MRAIILLLTVCLLVSCKNDQKTNGESEKPKTPVENKKDLSTREYNNEKWGFSLEHPENWQILESKLPGDVPVINVYSANSGFNPPFTIHEEAANPYIAILPKGFGVDAPSGEQRSLAEWDGNLSLTPELNETESKIYLLKSGEPWALYLRFKDAPSSWNEYGSIFVHFRIDDFKAECYSPSGKQKEMENCDPMGADEVRYSGEIDPSSKKALMMTLESFKFEAKTPRPISDLIQVEKPLPNKEVTSPLKISGKARGFWFFEADAPVVLLDKDNKQLAESYIQAEGEWMTEDFVEFTGSLQFEAPDDERGYLVFKRANPSDMRENDREYRLPVIFPPK